MKSKSAWVLADQRVFVVFLHQKPIPWKSARHTRKSRAEEAVALQQILIASLGIPSAKSKTHRRVIVQFYDFGR